MSIETQTGIPSPEDSQINDFVRKGVESADLPPRPQRLVDAMERAFGVDIQHIDEQYVGLGAEGAKRAFGYGEEPQAGETDPEVAGIEASKDMLDLTEVAAKPKRPSWIARFVDRLKSDDRGEVSTRHLAIGAGVLIAVGLVWSGGQLITNGINHTNAINDAHDKAAQEQLKEDWIDYSANNRSEDEELIGTFAIDQNNPTVNQGTINILGTSELSHTENQSGIDLGTYGPGDEFAVVKENVDNSPDGSKEVVVERLSTYNSAPTPEPEVPPNTK